MNNKETKIVLGRVGESYLTKKQINQMIENFSKPIPMFLEGLQVPASTTEKIRPVIGYITSLTKGINTQGVVLVATIKFANQNKNFVFDLYEPFLKREKGYNGWELTQCVLLEEPFEFVVISKENAE